MIDCANNLSKSGTIWKNDGGSGYLWSLKGGLPLEYTA